MAQTSIIKRSRNTEIVGTNRVKVFKKENVTVSATISREHYQDDNF